MNDRTPRRRRGGEAPDLAAREGAPPAAPPRNTDRGTPPTPDRYGPADNRANPETARSTGPGPGGWHIEEALAAAYARGAVREPDAWSLEKHLESCGPCAGIVSAAVRETAAGAVVADVRASVLGAVHAGARPAVSLGRLRGRDHRPRTAARRSRHGSPAGTAHPLPRPGAIRTGLLRTVGPALSRGWLGALAAVVAGAFAVSYGTGSEAARPLLLALAPALPPAGVALSYGRHADPLHEIAAATPSGGLRLLLTRSAAVLALSVTLLTAAGALLPAGGGAPGAATWLLPALALTAGALALGTWTGLRTAAAALAGGWLAVALYPAAGSSPGGFGTRLAPLLSGTAAQTGWAAAAALCTGLLVLRRTTFDHLEKA
ncbi:zf-HC2 domain-containing protein [Streptomyces tsukubensis]|uniref:zf-HC2 domain-containing protein n=1 Tax=Streptomyces tsukubensis TaxID=83656 RepID=UPI0036A8D009